MSRFFVFLYRWWATKQQPNQPVWSLFVFTENIMDSWKQWHLILQERWVKVGLWICNNNIHNCKLILNHKQITQWKQFHNLIRVVKFENKSLDSIPEKYLLFSHVWIWILTIIKMPSHLWLISGKILIINQLCVNISTSVTFCNPLVKGTVVKQQLNLYYQYEGIPKIIVYFNYFSG